MSEPLPGDHAAEVREIARQEISSLCGLVLRRLQDKQGTDSVHVSDVAEIFGEALHDFGGTHLKPGNDS